VKRLLLAGIAVLALAGTALAWDSNDPNQGIPRAPVDPNAVTPRPYGAMSKGSVADWCINWDPHNEARVCQELRADKEFWGTVTNQPQYESQSLPGWIFNEDNGKQKVKPSCGGPPLPSCDELDAQQRKEWREYERTHKGQRYY